MAQRSQTTKTSMVRMKTKFGKPWCEDKEFATVMATTRRIFRFSLSSMAETHIESRRRKDNFEYVRKTKRRIQSWIRRLHHAYHRKDPGRYTPASPAHLQVFPKHHRLMPAMKMTPIGTAALTKNSNVVKHPKQLRLFIEQNSLASSNNWT